ncbi:hypothetical protein JMUB6875_46900 [Nocardia sp. JMUB6875]|uniref:helix-turn-helix transcriptional regulator n=1 Tax=Nocardia sp. JMUB6875 TaxID=3158170 RepID=UPI0032E77ACC
MGSRGRERTFDRLTRLATAGLDTTDLIDEAGVLLAAAVPHDCGCWHTTDPDTLIETGFRAHRMPPPDAEVARFAYLPDDFNSFVRLAGARRRAGVLTEATGGRLEGSVRYRELLRPNNIRGELRVALVADGMCWGNISLFRETPHDFTADEAEFAHQVAGVLGQGLRSAGVRARAAVDGGTAWPGVLVLGVRGEVIAVSGPARAWLAELGAPGAPDLAPLPFAVLALAERARMEGEAASRVLGAGGRWVSLHASVTAVDVRPAAGFEVSLVLQQANPGAVAPLLYAAFGFTAREREIVELVVRGCSTAEVAERLFISPLTVQTHLTSIFGKAGVRSRRQLTGLVHADSAGLG